MFLDFWDSLIASKYTFKPIRTQNFCTPSRKASSRRFLLTPFLKAQLI